MKKLLTFLAIFSILGACANAQSIPVRANADGTVQQPVNFKGLVPAGGGNAQLLAKASGTDYDLIWITDAGTGSVTSVQTSGGTTGLTFSGGPITAAGTFTMAGTLALTNGGTGGTSAATARSSLGLLSMSQQAASAVAITGGGIDGSPIGNGTRAAGSFTGVDSTAGFFCVGTSPSLSLSRSEASL